MAAKKVKRKAKAAKYPDGTRFVYRESGDCWYDIEYRGGVPMWIERRGSCEPEPVKRSIEVYEQDRDYTLVYPRLATPLPDTAANRKACIEAARVGTVATVKRPRVRDIVLVKSGELTGFVDFTVSASAYREWRERGGK